MYGLGLLHGRLLTWACLILYGGPLFGYRCCDSGSLQQVSQAASGMQYTYGGVAAPCPRDRLACIFRENSQPCCKPAGSQSKFYRHAKVSWPAGADGLDSVVDHDGALSTPIGATSLRASRGFRLSAAPQCKSNADFRRCEHAPSVRWAAVVNRVWTQAAPRPAACCAAVCWASARAANHAESRPGRQVAATSNHQNARDGGKLTLTNDCVMDVEPCLSQYGMMREPLWSCLSKGAPMVYLPLISARTPARQHKLATAAAKQAPTILRSHRFCRLATAIVSPTRMVPLHRTCTRIRTRYSRP